MKLTTLGMLRIVPVIIAVFLTTTTSAQILINEFMASNGRFIQDEDGDYPDWIELFNTGTQPVNIGGWSLSDNTDELGKWRFPALTLAPNQYLLIFASDKDRGACCRSWQTLVDIGDNWRYKNGSDVQSLSWIEPAFNVDGSWQNGPTTIGYDPANADQIATEVAPTISLFLRKEFEITALSQVVEAILHVDFDDAFVAYINGMEVARDGLEGARPSFDARGSSNDAVIYQGGIPSAFSVPQSMLNEGSNVLAIQVHNINVNSTDLSITPFFSVKRAEASIYQASPRLDLAPDNLHTNFRISADGESLYLSDQNGTIIDSVEGVSLSTDISYGRLPSDLNTWVFYEDPTPGAENVNLGFAGLINEEPAFENDPGFFSDSELIVISPIQGYQIRYTTDGSPPTSNSTLYEGPFEIDDNTVIRAQYYQEGIPPGPIGTLTKILNSQVTEKNLPILSVSADPFQLFSDEEGLFLNMPGELEKQVYIELIEPDGSLGMKANAGMRIFGNESGTGFDFQQSLSFFARARYGDGSFNYRLFKEKNIDSFEAFILRNNNGDYDLYDGVGNGIIQDILDVQAYQPVVLFINGEYWGVLNMMEKINEHYLASNFDVDSDSVDLFNSVETDVPYYSEEWVMTGDLDYYVQTIDYMRENDLALDEHYEVIKTKILAH
ncbi:MAG: lamin tail domain-containing protein [Bacteroidota bacterium]